MLPYGSEFSNQAGEFPLQHYASEFALTYKGKFPILRSSKSAFLSNKYLPVSFRHAVKVQWMADVFFTQMWPFCNHARQNKEYDKE
jgi:hypothetical protein